jgi:hypothetical protein
MNQEQKPLSTGDIARGRDEPDDNRADARSEEGRRELESGYPETGMADTSETSATASLMPSETAEAHREHWTDIQTRFVDDPKDAVEQADELVAEVMQVVASRFADQRKGLESQWQAGGEVSTEDLRQALQQYRSFFERLLAA